MKVISYFSLFLLLFIYSCQTSINVVKVSKNTEVNSKKGIYYSLPRNYIKIEITVDETQLIKGPYADYAEKYLGLTNVIKNNSTVYEISGFSVYAVAEPDPEQYYFVEIPKNSTQLAKNFSIQLSEAGTILNSCNGTPENQLEKRSFSAKVEENIYPDIFKSYTDLNLFEKVDTIIEKTDTIEKITFRRSYVAKSPEQKAKDAADFIIKVKENRFNLISGFQEVNYDKETFKIMDEELESLENEYRKLFTGITFIRKKTYTFKYLPSPDKTHESLPLLKFSKVKGVMDVENSYGDALYLTISKLGITDSLQAYSQNKMDVKSKSHGFYYRIPDYADVILYFNDVTHIEERLLIPQYGVITTMPESFIHNTFFPETGMLKKTGK